MVVLRRQYPCIIVYLETKLFEFKKYIIIFNGNQEREISRGYFHFKFDLILNDEFFTLKLQICYS